MTILERPHPTQEDIELTDKIYAKAIELGFGPSQRKPISERALIYVYWAFILIAFGWLFSMSIDRTLPVRIGQRTVMNPGGKVMAGERLIVQSSRRRWRTCELTRRWWVIDGDGRRFDYEPERFDAYGPVTPDDAEDEVEKSGPMIPLDAVPGRGRWNSVLAWDCNMLQRALGWSIVLVQPPIEFEIVPRPKPPG